MITIQSNDGLLLQSQQFLNKMKCYAVGMNRIPVPFFSIIIALLVVMVPLPGTHDSLFAQEEGCESCHSGFRAFTMTVDAPTEVPQDYDFDYNVLVTNPGEHDLQNVAAVLDISKAPTLEFARNGSEPYHGEESGSVSALSQSQSFQFPILAGANEAVITLDGDEGIHGRNDIDLIVNSPEGQSWESTGGTADEAVSLDLRDFQRGGYGEWEAVVQYFVGSLSVSFTLTIDVEYGLGQMRLEGPDLGPGEKHTFTWKLHSTKRGDNAVDVLVSGLAHHEHGEVEAEESEEYTEEETRDLEVGDKLVHTPPGDTLYFGNPVLAMERTLGLLSALFLLISAAFSGIYTPVQTRVEKLVGGAAKRVRWHCRTSLLLLMMSGIHGILLPFSPHASSFRGLSLGVPSFLAMGALGYLGWQQQTYIKRLGKDKWKKIHLVLTILVLLMVAAHATLDGSDFAWLR